MRVKKMMQVLERYFLKKLALVNGDMYKKLYPKYLRKIGININQIAKRVNSTNTIYDEDIFEIKEQMKKIWQLQRYILSNQP